MASNLPATTETEVVEYQADASVGSNATLKSLIEGQRESLTALLPAHLSPSRLLKTLFLAVNRQPKLLECTQASVLQAVIQTAELGLDLSPARGEAYLVPFKVKVKGANNRVDYQEQATFIPGYRGLAKLARQAKPDCRIEAEVVYEGDHFIYQKGDDPKVEFRPKLSGERGKPIGAYSLFQAGPGMPAQSDFMSIADLEAIRKRSKAGDSGPWKTDRPEMQRKTVWRRLSKWVPLSSDPNYAKALAAAEAGDETEFSGLELPTGPPEEDGDRTKALAEKLSGNGDGELFPDDEPEVDLEREAKSAEAVGYFVPLFEKAENQKELEGFRSELGEDTDFLLPDDKRAIADAYKNAVKRTNVK